MTDKTLNQHHLGEEILKADAERYFGKDFCKLFKFPLKLVGLTFAVKDNNGLQMDYTLKNKSYIDKED